jgi:hypothetical protein
MTTFQTLWILSSFFMSIITVNIIATALDVEVHVVVYLFIGWFAALCTYSYFVS